MAFVHDSETRLRDAIITPQRRHEAQVEEMLRAEAQNCVYVRDGEVAPADAGRQLGTPLTSADVEARLAKILEPGFVCVDHPWNETKKLVVRRLPSGTQETICVYERGLMPEHSIMRIKVEEIRDVDQKHLSRADLPKYEISPTGEIIWDPTKPKPGWKRVERLWGEKVRGWRTLLIRLIQARAISLSDAEKYFGSDNRPQWAANTGKQQLLLPW